MRKLHLVLTITWGCLAIPTVIWWKDSILWVALMSVYACMTSHWSSYQASRAEQKASEDGTELMAIFPLSPVIPDLRILRSYPCGAVVAPEMECGATPASLYRRACGVIGHERDIWLCPIHATMAACGGAICRECAQAGGIVPVILARLTEPLRF